MSPDPMVARERAATDIGDPNAAVFTLETFSVEDGRPGAIDIRRLRTSGSARLPAAGCS